MSNVDPSLAHFINDTRARLEILIDLVTSEIGSRTDPAQIAQWGEKKLADTSGTGNSSPALPLHQAAIRDFVASMNESSRLNADRRRWNDEK